MLVMTISCQKFFLSVLVFCFLKNNMESLQKSLRLTLTIENGTTEGNNLELVCSKLFNIFKEIKNFV
uniref:Uncharacterized protein n=1 Tax=Octopus bimaculoides TaxID=37653 RepID=A0A0L8FP72_OCTBM